MRRYISKETLQAARESLVEGKDSQLLEICSQLTKYRSQQNFAQSDYIQDMLHLDNRIFLTGFDTLVTLYGMYILRRLYVKTAGRLLVYCFLSVFAVWILYLIFEIVSIVKVYSLARSYILVDELIEREMIGIGEIRE